MRILVTDAELTLTLAALRTLDAAGHEVVAAAPSPRAHGFRSRAVRERLVSPRPADDERFVQFVCDTARDRRIDVVLPIGQESTAALARHRGRLPPWLGLAVAPWEAIEVAMSKRRTLELAASLGIRTPATYARAEDISEFPVVAKPTVGSGSVRYANDRRELADVDESWLVQEYVPGEGRGLFALLDSGEPRAVFMHRRLRELPVTGGASTAAESVDDPELRELGLRLLRALAWHGVAMVEFKRDSRDGGYTLMEVNPKFWGSLALAIAAGVDFPRLAVLLAAGRSFDEPRPRAATRFQWVVADLVHGVARPRDLPAVLRDLVDPRVHKDVSLRDPMPTLAETAASARAVVRAARAGTLRHPHGRPGRGRC